MKEQKLHQGHFGKNPQKAVKSGQYNKTRDTMKILHAAKILQPVKFNAIFTLPLYLAPIAIFFVHAASSSARVLRI